LHGLAVGDGAWAGNDHQNEHELSDVIIGLGDIGLGDADLSGELMPKAAG